MAKQDYYQVLGVGKTATPDEIKRAHRTLVRKYHPDVNTGKADTSTRFQEVQEAYDVLSDESKRKLYDQYGHDGLNAGGASAGGDPWEELRRARGGGPTRWRSGPNTTVEDFDMGGGDFSSVFEQLFGRGQPGGASAAGRGRRAAPSKGADISHPVTLSFEQAARGTSLPLQINDAARVETIDIRIPAGVKDGSRVRVKGKGERSRGEPGDLYIVTGVREHPYYRRDGLDVLLDLPISVDEAILGTKVEVPTLDGPVTLTIPPGTGSGAKLRIRERGIHRGSEKGDQHVIVKVIVPKLVDDRLREIAEEIRKSYPVDARGDAPWK